MKRTEEQIRKDFEQARRKMAYASGAVDAVEADLEETKQALVRGKAAQQQALSELTAIVREAIDMGIKLEVE